jgi:hypothetical protein
MRRRASRGVPDSASHLEAFPMLVRLTDEELNHVLHAAQPLDPACRGDFLQAVAAELQRYTEPGPGDVDRAIRATQRKFFDPPLESHAMVGGKYR